MIWELALNKALKNMPGASPCTYNKVVTIPANTLNDPAPANCSSFSPTLSML